jgi:hypothetical protein
MVVLLSQEVARREDINRECWKIRIRSGVVSRVVLVVDDDLEVLEVLAAMLRIWAARSLQRRGHRRRSISWPQIPG